MTSADPRSPLRLVGGAFVDDELSFPMRVREVHTTPAGRQVVRTMGDDLISIRR